ncbi:Asp-tRNA(Asn)/Glu-tRNA(Gln) amidotransferase A subunit family amidase [Rhizobium petrolearium]|uniref:amidase n=1 Tax=Neorhizobium petrolearium TaxID=515361 RepID=UPI001AE3490A|nr:amidase family protein [Neorhizobium petrolearium]MBP1847680.1 Asp-tRNA(Asn)/Glu-tRNA(Gln) amidotransferase A subunit family amidase [Neorhizobium petrolearium]
MSKIHPADLDAMDARRLIGQRRLSPVELAEACIERVTQLNPAVNAIVAQDFDRVLTEARHAEQSVMRHEALGPLHGLPFGVKDMIDVQGLPTTFGSEIFRDNIAVKDDAIVAAMRRAGGIPLGKTNNPDWSAGGNTRNAVYGVTANPHDTTKSAAGSSGGSAALLAARMAPLATGSDTGGSLRNPAAFCGVVGFRPSPGVVPGDTRAMALMHLSTSGPMARSVADVALMLSVMARPDRLDPYTVVIDGQTPWQADRFGHGRRPDLTALRIAVTADFGFAPTSRVIREAFGRVVARLSDQLGRVEETHPNCNDADRIFSILRGVMFLGMHHTLLQKHPDKIGPNVRANVEEGLSYGPLDIADALVKQGRFYRNWQRFFEDHDYVLSPAVTISPRDWHELYPTEIDGQPTKNYYHWLAMAYASTLAGHPSITIPVGRDALGMPFGLQIVGRRHDDAGVLQVAAALEEIFAGDPVFGIPIVDVETLKAAPKLADCEGFLGF